MIKGQAEAVGEIRERARPAPPPPSREHPKTLQEAAGMDYTEDQYARLPRWARKHIMSLERQVEDKDRKIAELSDGPAGSRVRQHDYVNPDRVLPNDEVEFYLGNSAERWEDMVACRVQDGVLKITTHAAGRNRTGVLKPVTSSNFDVFFAEEPK